MSGYDLKQSIGIIKNNWKDKVHGAITDIDIEHAFYSDDIFIYPFQSQMLTAVGYNLCPSDLIISTRTGMPLSIIKQGNQKYVNIAPHDTVLISTREYVGVSNRIMGTFHSRVKIVSQGFGHISTTLDPTWRGPLLIALSNPSGQKTKLVLEDRNEPQPFATLVFYCLDNCAQRTHDNKPNRIDILQEYRARPGRIKQFFFGSLFKKYNAFIDDLIIRSKNLNEHHINCPALEEMRILIQEGQEIICTQSSFDERKMRFTPWTQKIKNFEGKYRSNEDYATICNMVQPLRTVLNGINVNNLNDYFADLDTYFIYIGNYFEKVLDRINKEMIGKQWVHEYSAVIEFTGKDDFTTRVMRFVFGQKIRRIVLTILTIAALIVGIFIIKPTESQLKEALVAAFIATIVALVVDHWSK